MSVEHWKSEGMNWEDPTQIKPAYPYLEALRLAIIERCDAMKSREWYFDASIYIGGGGTQLPYQKVDLKQSSAMSPCNVFILLTAMSMIIKKYFLDNKTLKFVDFDVNGGDYTGLNNFPYFWQVNMLEKVGENNLDLPTSPYPLTYSELMYSELMYKLYKILNQCRWLASLPDGILSMQRKIGSAEINKENPTPQDISDLMDAAEVNWANAQWVDEPNWYGLNAIQRSHFFNWSYSKVIGRVENARQKVSITSSKKHSADFYAVAWNNYYNSYYFNSTDGFLEKKLNKYYSSSTESYYHESTYVMESKQQKAYLDVNNNKHNFNCDLKLYDNSYYNDRPPRVIQKFDGPNGFQFGDWRGD